MKARWPTDAEDGPPRLWMGAEIPDPFAFGFKINEIGYVGCWFGFDESEQRWRPVRYDVTAPEGEWLDPARLSLLAENADKLVWPALRRYVEGAWNMRPPEGGIDAFVDRLHAARNVEVHSKFSPELLPEVAAVYRANPGKPTRAVADKWQLSSATASRWVKAARDKGLLEPR